MAVLFDQYTVSGLTNCLVDFKHCNKTLKCFETFSNVIQRLIYKGSYGLQCSQSVIPACFEMNESSASWKTNTWGKAASLMLFSIFVHDPGLMTLDLYNIIARASNAWTVSELPPNGLTMFLLCSWKVKRLALKEKKKINMWQVYIECKGWNKFCNGNYIWEEVLIFQKFEFHSLAQQIQV